MVLVFDEVDAGIGGRAAERVGRALAELAQHHQIICITHLPQIAAFADRHFVVRKEASRGRTRTRVAEVRDDDRIDERPPPPEDGGAPMLGCAADEDCGPAEACVSGACEPLPPGQCRAAADCDPGEVCVEGACAPVDDTCQFDHDCGPGRGCVDNACRPRCADDGECTAGTTCADGLCQPTAECGGDADCDAGETCVSGRCLGACADAADCGADEVCADDGVCRPDVAPRPFCAADDDCAGGHLCVFGVCRTPCPTGTDEECQRWDSQLVRCAESESGQLLCFSRHETNPECTTPADCADGERCIDAICHP